MAVTHKELGRRLRAARENCGLTQEAVADGLRIPRTAVVALEAGDRAVNSIELEQLARLFGRGISEFVGEASFEEDPVQALFRAGADVGNDPALQQWLRTFSGLCREAKRLEGLLGYPQPAALAVSYPVASPSSRWDAICQGRSIAEQERNRLGLGAAPVWDLAGVVRNQGVRVVDHVLPQDISGMFLHGRDVGAVIIINRDHLPARRFFSAAHEYCHVLVDRSRAATVSRTANRDELAEVRANAFAAHFLMPEAGVRSFMQTIGKGEATRQVQEVFDGSEQPQEPLSAQRRAAPGTQDVQAHDLVRFAHLFRVSYEAALFHLLNLKVIAKDGFDRLREQREAMGQVRTALGLPDLAAGPEWTLAEHLVSIGLEAYRRGLITRAKLREIAAGAEVARSIIDAAIDAVAEPIPPTEVVLPE